MHPAMEEKNITIQLHGIEIVEKWYKAIPIQLQVQDFKFDWVVKAGVDGDRKLLIVWLDISIRKGDEPQVLSRLTTATAFQLPDLEQDLPKLENGTYTIPHDLDTMVKSVALSTARGILFSELRGTVFHHAILPLIQLPLPQAVSIDDTTTG